MSKSLERIETLRILEKKKLFDYMNEIEKAKLISEHYLSYTNIAIDLKQMCELRENMYYEGKDTTNIDEAIKYELKLIKNGHLNDLGIELSWNYYGTNHEL